MIFGDDAVQFRGGQIREDVHADPFGVQKGLQPSLREFIAYQNMKSIGHFDLLVNGEKRVERSEE